MTLIVKNALGRCQHVLLVKEVCTFTIQNALMFVLNQLCKVEILALIVTQLVLNAHRQLINVQSALKDSIFMKANVKNVLMVGKEMMTAGIVKK